MAGPFTYALGRNRYDALPQRREAATWRDFARDVLSHRAESKATAGYIVAAMSCDGRRSRGNAEPCAWLALDADGISADVWPDWRMHLAARFRGFGWPTASSTPEAPRERVIIELSEPVDRAQRMALGALLAQDIGDNFGASVTLDPCVYRPEQPLFLAPVGAQPFYLLGDALDVPTWLEQAPPAPADPPPPSAEVVALADVRMRQTVQTLHAAGMLTRELPGGTGYAMRCPWERTHTTMDPPGSSATALLFPSEANGWRGAFKCMHAHCAARGLRQLLDVLDRAARMQRQQQERQAS